MNPVAPLEKGLRPLTALCRKVNEITSFLARLRPIAGEGITLTETADGTIFRAGVSDSSAFRRNGADPWRYDGPFALSVTAGSSNRLILCRPGLLCRNGDCSMTTTLSMSLPEQDCGIALRSTLRANGEWSEPELCAADLPDPSGTTVSPSSWTGYFILGAFSVSKKTVTQYHCSPVIHLIVAGDLIV